MPILSQYFIRAALIYLSFGVTLGAMLLISKATLAMPFAWSLLPVHVYWLLVGWMLQLAFGVTYWILPRFGVDRPRSNLAWGSFVLLNCALLLMAVAVGLELFGHKVPIVRLLAAGLLGTSIALYAAHIWPRVKGIG